jgi:uncharacterized protein YraI
MYEETLSSDPRLLCTNRRHIAELGVACECAITGSEGGYSGNGVNIRTGPSTGYTIIGEGYEGQLACIWGYVDGQEINGTPIWVDHDDFSTGVGPGYATDYYMYQYYPTQNCYID